jgi:hypothetical protein
VSVSSLSARPSPVNRRVGIHDFTFEACSSFTRVTACKVARPPKDGLVSRGFDLASCPTKSLGSYHVLPTATWMDPPSIGDLRHWGALLTQGGGQTGVRQTVDITEELWIETARFRLTSPEVRRQKRGWHDLAGRLGLVRSLSIHDAYQYLASSFLVHSQRCFCHLLQSRR